MAIRKSTYYPVVTRTKGADGRTMEKFVKGFRGAAKEAKDQRLERQHIAERELSENEFVLLPTPPKKIQTDNVVGIWREALRNGETAFELQTRFSLTNAELEDWTYRACEVRGMEPLTDSGSTIDVDAIQGAGGNGGETAEATETAGDTTETEATEATTDEATETGVVKGIKARK